MRRTVTSMLLLLMLLNSSVFAANALIDICCDLTDRGTSAYTLADDSDSENHKAHIAHCCHASVHFSALGLSGDDSLKPSLQTTWPVMTAGHKAFLTHAPPVPPPNV